MSDFRDHETQEPTVASAVDHMRSIFTDAATGHLANPRSVAEHVGGWLAERLAASDEDRPDGGAAVRAPRERVAYADLVDVEGRVLALQEAMCLIAEALHYQRQNGTRALSGAIEVLADCARRDGWDGRVEEFARRVDAHMEASRTPRLYTNGFAAAAGGRDAPGGHPEDVCRRCGGANVSWAAPSPLWNAVMRGGSIDGPWEFDELICPACFVVLAEERGIATGWTVDAETVNVELETVTPSGRTWDPVRRLWVTRDERGPQDAEAVRLDVARVPVLPEVARAVELAQAARAEELAALPPHVRSLVEQADQRVSAAVADVVLNGNAGVRRPLLWEGDQA